MVIKNYDLLFKVPFICLKNHWLNMITAEHIKEAISIKYIELISAYCGYKTNTNYPDYGTDLELKEVSFRNDNEGRKFFDSGRELEFQLKATTEDKLEFEGDYIKFDLKAKSYNDLIARRDKKYPLILILFVLPTDYSNWVSLSNEELVARKCAYWYMPNDDDCPTEQTQIRIKISLQNIINFETINTLFEKYS